MNAPAHKTDIAPDSAYKLLFVDDIVPSDTHIQQLRRARYDSAVMIELIESVRAHGVLQAILVRENPAWTSMGKEQWQLVAGERRWLAAREAGLEHIPAVTRTLTDLQVLEIQLIENLQREGLHPLEEAEGFADLMQLKGVGAEAIAETIGRSKSHVFGRLKLLDLIPAAREAFNGGKIDLSKAQLIARVPLPKLQAKALKQAQALDWKGQPFSFREFKDWLEKNKFTVELKNATFRLADAKLFPAAGSCSECPKRTGNAADLFDDVKDPNVCTDPDCFGKKMAAQVKHLRAEAEASGRTIIAGDAAKAIIGSRYGQIELRGYIDLDAETDEEFEEPEPEGDETGIKDAAYRAWEERMEAFKPRTYRQVLGDALNAEAVVLLDDGKKLREIVPVPIAKRLLKAHGITLPGWIDSKPEPAVDPAERKAELEKQAERQEHELAFRSALLAQIHAKWKPPLKREDLVALVGDGLRQRYHQRLLETCYGGHRIDVEKLSEADLMRVLVELTVADVVDSTHASPAPLLALAKRCRIDPAKVKKDLAVAEKAKDKPAAVKTPARGLGPEIAAKNKVAKKKAVKK